MSTNNFNEQLQEFLEQNKEAKPIEQPVPELKNGQIWHYCWKCTVDRIFDTASGGRARCSSCNTPLPYLRDVPKQNRNEICNCGSKLKFKKCCGMGK